MIWQFLRGSTEEVYRIVESDLPVGWSSLIPESTESLLSYGLDGDPHHYSMMPLDTGSGIKLLFSCCARKCNAISPSYFVHKQVTDCDSGMLLNDFDGLLSSPFFTEEEFDAIAAKKPGVLPSGVWSGPPVEIHTQVLRGILYGILSRWRAGSAPVVIAVPQMDGVQYDRYTLGAVRTIYSYLPAGIRALAGFMTYTAPVNKLNEVALFFLPERTAPDGIRLDRETESSRKLLDSYIPDSIRGLIDRMVDNPQLRQSELQQLWETVEAQVKLDGLREKHYTALLEYRPLLDLDVNGQQTFDQISSFFRNKQSVPDPVCSTLVTALLQKVTAAHLDTYALNRTQTDDSFVGYVNRVRSHEGLCCESTTLMEQAKRRIIETFREYLAGCSEPESMEALEQQLTELNCDPCRICSNAELDACWEHWKNAAMPVYAQKFSGDIDTAKQKLDAILCGIPENADLDTVRRSIPDDPKTRIGQIKAWLDSQLDKLPRQFKTLPESTLSALEEFNSQISQTYRDLAGLYCAAAHRSMEDAFARVPAGLKQEVDQIQVDLQDLLMQLPVEYEPQIEAFQEQVTKRYTNLTEQYRSAAGAKLNAVSESDPWLLEEAVRRIETDLREQLGRLPVCADAYTGAFHKNAEAVMLRLLTAMCDMQSLDQNDRDALTQEQKRLEQLQKYLKEATPRYDGLRERLKNSLKRVNGARSGKPVKQKSSKSTGRQPQAPQRTMHIPNVSNPVQPQDPRQDGPAVASNEPVQAKYLVRVYGRKFEKILDLVSEFSQKEAGAPEKEYVKLKDKTAECTYPLASLNATLATFGKCEGVPHGVRLDEAALTSLLRQLSQAKLNDSEKTQILTVLAQWNVSAGVVAACMNNLIGDYRKMRAPYKGEIRGVLEGNEAYAQILNDVSGGDDARSFGSVFPAQSEERKIFWTGYASGALTMLVLCLVIAAAVMVSGMMRPDSLAQDLPNPSVETTAPVVPGSLPPEETNDTDGTDASGESAASDTTALSEGEATPDEDDQPAVPIG